jgi:heme-degrading monooxygenase HmoA
MRGAPGGAMRESVYTLAEWRVMPGREAEFVTAWKELGTVFARLPQPPADRGTLVRSVDDPLLFYSFGPWRSLEDVEAMRENAQAAEGVRRLRALCTAATPGTFRVVAESQ